MRHAKVWVLAALLVAGCASAPASPCDEMCDGTVRCIAGNEACGAEGFSGDGAFAADCVRLCEAAGTGLDASQETDTLACLDCLRAGTDFASCNGETALDAVCHDVCRTDAAAAFCNTFGPANFDAQPGIECLRR